MRKIEASGGLGHGWPTPSSREKGEGVEEEDVLKRYLTKFHIVVRINVNL